MESTRIERVCSSFKHTAISQQPALFDAIETGCVLVGVGGVGGVGATKLLYKSLYIYAYILLIIQDRFYSICLCPLFNSIHAHKSLYFLILLYPSSLFITCSTKHTAYWPLAHSGGGRGTWDARTVL